MNDARTRQVLRQADARIDRADPRRASLDPDRERASSLLSLGERLLTTRDTPALAQAFCDGLAELAVAQLESFPENLFWDLDFPAAQMLEQARRASDPVAVCRDLFARTAELQRLYGRETAIRFRYVHDFSYGYDWAKWVGREPTQDGSVGPFDLEFLAYMKRRAHELEALIEADDEKYPRLRDERPRNPFVFSREPQAEFEILRALAKRGSIPVEAWRVDATPDPHRPYADLRVQLATELGWLVEP